MKFLSGAARTVCIFAVVASLSSSGRCQETSVADADPDIEALMAETDAIRPQFIRTLRQQLAQLNRTRMTPKEREVKRKRIKDLIKKAEAGLQFIPIYKRPPFKLGDVGMIEPVRVLQVPSEDQLLVEFGDDGRIEDTVLLRGVETNGIISGATFTYPHPVLVARTETYTAASGVKRTVFVLKPFNSQLVFDALEARAKGR